MTDDTSGTGRAKRGMSAIAGAIAGLLLATVIAAVVWLGIWNRFSARTIDLSQPTVIHQIQQLHRLETVVFKMEKIVTGGQESRYLPTFLIGDRLLLVAYGEVTAGVDLSAIEPGDVRVEEGSVHIKMPAAELFSTRVDNDRTRVYSRETGLFSSVDPNLESDVRRAAEQEIRQAALDGGVLNVATQNARSTLTAFVSSLGFEQVTLE